MDVFLSYSAANEKTGRRLSEHLVEEGLTVHCDAEIHRAGGNWRREIEEAARSAAGIVLLIGPRDPDEVQDVSWRAALQAMWSDESKRLAPVLLRREKLPTFLRSEAVRPVRFDKHTSLKMLTDMVLGRFWVTVEPGDPFESSGGFLSPQDGTDTSNPVEASPDDSTGLDYPGPPLDEDREERTARLEEIRELARQLR